MSNASFPQYLESDVEAYKAQVFRTERTASDILLIVTGIWAFIGLVLPVIFARGPNARLIAACLMLAAFCCWLLWICFYMAQRHPLIGPELKNTTLMFTALNWKDSYISQEVKDMANKMNKTIPTFYIFEML